MKNCVLTLAFLAGMVAIARGQTALSTIEGRTVAMDGQPLGNVSLALRSIPAMQPGEHGPVAIPPPVVSFSGPQGSFTFTGLTPGRYTLVASHAGYIGTAYGLKGGSSSRVLHTFEVAAGQRMTGVAVEMIPQSTISGTVTDEVGDPMPGVRAVAAVKQYGEDESRLISRGSAVTDDHGNYRIEGLERGRYVLSYDPNPPARGNAHMAAPGPAREYAVTYFPGTSRGADAKAVEVEAREDKAGINVSLRKVPVYHIRGKVDGGGSQLRIRLSRAGGEFDGTTYAVPLGSEGKFDFARITSGAWVISVAQPPTQTLSAIRVQVGNADVNDVNLPAGPLVELKGVVRMDALSKGAAPAALPEGLSIHLVASGVPMSGSVDALVQPDGSFTLHSVGALHYRLFQSGAGYLKSATLNGKDVLADGLDVAGSSGKLELVAGLDGGAIRGSVMNADGSAAANAGVTLVPEPPQPERTELYRLRRADATGQFSLAGIKPGKYRVYAWEDSDRRGYTDPDYMKAFATLGTGVTVEANGTSELALREISAAQAMSIEKGANLP